jgi:ABC-type transport system involved in cytochrome c biogenesis permease subunit
MNAMRANGVSSSGAGCVRSACGKASPGAGIMSHPGAWGIAKRCPSEATPDSNSLGLRSAPGQGTRWFPVCVLTTVFLTWAAILAATAGPVLAADAIDYSTWRRIPAFHHGRPMPLDTYARSAVDVICHSERGSVKLGLDAYYTPAELAGDRLAGAVELFPDGKTRRPDPTEMLLSWMVEPEKWEDVPFLYAAHKELRDLLKLPEVGVNGQHLSFASPRQILESRGLADFFHADHDHGPPSGGPRQPPPSETLKTEVRQMLERYTLYRKLSFDPRKDVSVGPVPLPGDRSRLMAQLAAASGLIYPKEQGSQALLQQLVELSRHERLPGEAREEVIAVHVALQELVEMYRNMAAAAEGHYESPPAGEGNGEAAGPTASYPLAQVEDAVLRVRESAGLLAKLLEEQKSDVFRGGSSAADPHGKDIRPLVREVAYRCREIDRLGLEMHLALYDNGESLYVVPALNAAALASNRDVKSDAKPWVSLTTLVYGSEALLFQGESLATYPRSQVVEVRRHYLSLAEAFRDRAGDSRKSAVEASIAGLAAALADLGRRIEPQRVELVRGSLPANLIDDRLMEYTRYPNPTVINTEVKYNAVNPFAWSIGISIAAAILFSLAFGVQRSAMTWLGIAAAILAIVWTTYGFYLRVIITQWAPVTNMYETVVFVPFVVLCLGIWFMLLPVTWTGVTAAWRLTAVPLTWEAVPPAEEHRRLLPEAAWDIASWLLLLPRIAVMAGIFWFLSIAQYSDGDRAIFALAPDLADQSNFGGMLNKLIVWGLGLVCMAASVWFGPRVALAAAASAPLTVLSWRDGAFGRMVQGVYPRRVFGLAAACVAAFLFLVAANAPVLDREFTPLQPVLRSNFWLTVHVLTIVASYGAGFLAWFLGMVALTFYLFGAYRRPVVAEGVEEGFRPAGDAGETAPQAMTYRPPEVCATLAHYIYRVTQVAVLLLAVGTMLGGLWADVSWGRFWGWDPKEVWALISLLVYLSILHGRFAGLFNNFALVFGSVFGWTMIVMSWYGVNFVLGAGLHSYGFGDGGQTPVYVFVALNWLYLGAATLRYLLTTSIKTTPVKDAVAAELADAATR